MAKVTVRRTRKIKVEPTPAVRNVADLVVRHMQDRLRQGIGHDGIQMPQRSPLYRKQLAAIGLGGTPVGVVTGGLAASIMLLRVRGDPLVPRMVFGPDGKSSASPARPPWWCFDPKKSPAARAWALAGWLVSRHRPPARKSHKRVMRWFVGGYRGRVIRRAVGITSAARLQILRAIERAKVFTG